jgi:type IV pilus assembly protein PilB
MKPTPAETDPRAKRMFTEAEARALFVDQLELVNAEEFETCQSLARRMRVPIEQTIAERGRVPLRFVLEQIADSWGVQFTELKTSKVDIGALRRIREDAAKARQVVAFASTGEGLSVAMADPRDRATINDLRRMTGMAIVPFLAEISAIQRAQLLYREEIRGMLRAPAGENMKVDANEADATALLSRILEFAAVSGASDIHIEPYGHELLVRARVDGVLQDIISRPPSDSGPLAARIKVLAGMRIDDKRSPQDGRFEQSIGGVRLDLRVSSLPTQFGEKVVMRVIAQDGARFDLEALGLHTDDFAIVSRTLSKPFGMVLVTGPTGSGKSTSLYAMIARLTAERQSLVNISTIEDPVEHTLPRVTQVSINTSAGIDFAHGLRALLRQDPDVIMVGEIRDRETAETAVRAALVGRLLISTLHTNDTVSAIPRLLDMGIEPFLLSSTVAMIIAQRLARRICTGCRESVALDEATASLLTERADWDRLVASLQARGILGGGSNVLSDIRLFRGRGCAACNNTGFKGRTGIFEVLEINHEMRRAMLTRPDAAALSAIALRNGMRTMFEDGLAKVLLGETTLEELARVAA